MYCRCVTTISCFSVYFLCLVQASTVLKGALHVQMTPDGLVEVTEFDTKDGIYDCAWSEVDLVLVAVALLFTAHALTAVPHTGK